MFDILFSGLLAFSFFFVFFWGFFFLLFFCCFSRYIDGWLWVIDAENAEAGRQLLMLSVVIYE